MADACSTFQPSWDQVASSWRRKSANTRDQHFFAQLDFVDGQAIYQRVRDFDIGLDEGFPQRMEEEEDKLTSCVARFDFCSYRPIPPRCHWTQQIQQAFRYQLRSKQAVSTFIVEFSCTAGGSFRHCGLAPVERNNLLTMYLGAWHLKDCTISSLPSLPNHSVYIDHSTLSHSSSSQQSSLLAHSHYTRHMITSSL